MHWTEEVIDSLNWVEGKKVNVNEYGVPVAHSTIPEAWELESLELLTAL